ncbi:DinB family protein [Pelomonas sp. KK5]|uniref:DinB family protein n=1 Tax=Pelomonas sp. KK5 TaxID=1855730 RepID=UPI00097C2A92|nr:DinB family protein [Pelomonas sp. KK5]
MSLATLKTMFAYKAWSNEELFELLSTLAPDRADKVLTPALRRLNHIYVVDRLFRARLAGEASEPFEATNTRETPALSQLREDVAATDRWYVDYVRALTEPQLAEPLPFRFTDGDAGRMTREEILVHVSLHGGYHRGNVGQILTDAGINPPRDLYTKFLHLAEPARRAG